MDDLLQPAPSTENGEPRKSFIAGNKGLALAGLVVVIIVVTAVMTMVGSSDAGKYQGMIKLVEQETESLQTR